MSSFQGRVAIVTGAGRGIGKAHALELARRGAKVVVNDLGASLDGSGGASWAARDVADQINAEGGAAIANIDSVATRDGAARLVADAIDAYGRVDILINNAGVLRDRSFKNMSLDDFEYVVQVHLMGSTYVTHAAWKHMYDQRYGRILFTSSSSGIYGNFGQSNYGAAKMALLGLMNVLAIEGASRNVRVNCIAPGAATRMTASVPGRSIDPDNPPSEFHPNLVTPAALVLCDEDAPTGVTLNSVAGSFSRAQIFVNQGVVLGTDASYEDLSVEIDRLLDMSNAKPRSLISSTG